MNRRGAPGFGHRTGPFEAIGQDLQGVDGSEALARFSPWRDSSDAIVATALGGMSRGTMTAPNAITSEQARC